MEILIKTDDLGIPLFLETPIYTYVCMYIYIYIHIHVLFNIFYTIPLQSLFGDFQFDSDGSISLD